MVSRKKELSLSQYFPKSLFSTSDVKSKVYSFGNVKIFPDNMEKQGRSSPANKEDIGDLQLLTNGCLSFKGVKLSQNYWAYH